MTCGSAELDLDRAVVARHGLALVGAQVAGRIGPIAERLDRIQHVGALVQHGRAQVVGPVEIVVQQLDDFGVVQQRDDRVVPLRRRPASSSRSLGPPETERLERLAEDMSTPAEQCATRSSGYSAMGPTSSASSSAAAISTVAGSSCAAAGRSAAIAGAERQNPERQPQPRRQPFGCAGNGHASFRIHRWASSWARPARRSAP